MNSIDLESAFKQYAIFSPETYKSAPIKSILKDCNLIELSKGLNARVYKIENQPWVVKEGRWDLSIDLIKDVEISLPANLISGFLEKFDYTFLPEIKEILSQYEAYLNFSTYFGFFHKKDFYHPNIKLINDKQKLIRDSLYLFSNEIEKKYKIKFNSKFLELLKSNFNQTNFLPKEYLLVGKSIHKSSKNKLTYYIAQEFVEGQLLHDANDDNFNKDNISKLLILAYLILFMNYQSNLLPDTRSRYFLFQTDWFRKTDNIIINKTDVKFVDTRWVWQTDSNFIKRGIFAPDLIINSSKSFIDNYSKKI